MLSRLLAGAALLRCCTAVTLAHRHWDTGGALWAPTIWLDTDGLITPPAGVEIGVLLPLYSCNAAAQQCPTEAAVAKRCDRCRRHRAEPACGTCRGGEARDAPRSPSAGRATAPGRRFRHAELPPGGAAAACPCRTQRSFADSAASASRSSQRARAAPACSPRVGTGIGRNRVKWEPADVRRPKWEPAHVRRPKWERGRITCSSDCSGDGSCEAARWTRTDEAGRCPHRRDSR